MVNTFAAIGLGALVALSPLAAIAQTDGAAQPMQVAQAAPAATNSAHAGGGGKAFAPPRQRPQGTGEGWGGTYAQDAHGARGSEELTDPRASCV